MYTYIHTYIPVFVLEKYVFVEFAVLIIYWDSETAKPHPITLHGALI